MVFLSPFCYNLRQYLKIGNGHFLPYGFQLFINIPLQDVAAGFIIIINSEYRIHQVARIFSHSHAVLTVKMEVMQKLTLTLFKT
jgi:hypothetical protein